MKKLMMACVAAVAAVSVFGGTELIDVTALLRDEGAALTYDGTTIGNAGYPAANGMDGRTDTQCLLKMATADAPSVYAFRIPDEWRSGDVVRLTSFSITCAGSSAAYRMLSDFTLEARVGNDWMELGRWFVVRGSWTSGETRTFDLQHFVNARDYRLVIADGGNVYCTIAELALFGTVNDNEGAKHQHVEPAADDWEVVREPTATEPGEKVRKCTMCGAVLESKEIPVPDEAEPLPTADTIELVAELNKTRSASYTATTWLAQESGYVPFCAFDNAPSSHWLSQKTSVVPHYLTMTVADGVNGGKGVRVRKVELDSDRADRSPTEFDLQGSADGESWMTLASYNGAAWSALSLEIAEPAFYLQYRLSINHAPRSSYHCIQDVRMYGELRESLLSVEEVQNVTYDGDHEYRPKVVVRDPVTGELLQPGDDTYRLVWKNNTAMGSASVTVIGRKDYAGEYVERPFQIMTPGWIDGGVYVATDGNDTTGDGTWEKPFATVAYAVAQAPSGGGVIMKQGTYRSSGQIVIDKALTIRGVPGDRTAVVFSGDSDGDGVADKPGFRVSANVRVVFEGFTLEKCHNEGTSSVNQYGAAINFGAGVGLVTNMCLRAGGSAKQGNLMWFSNCRIEMADCAIVDNVAADEGGLVFLRNYKDGKPSLWMHHCVVSNNACYVFGTEGATELLKVEDCLFARNPGIADTNGHATFDRCRFVDIVAGAYMKTIDGAQTCLFRMENGESSFIRNCLFENVSGADRLFYFLLTSDFGATFDNGLGHYIQNCTFRNCNATAFAQNSGSSKSKNSFLENCLFYGGTVSVASSILADNMRNNLETEKDPFVAGNSDGECRFVKGLTDAGYPRVGCEGETDLVGKPRVLGAAIDIGCCEHKPLGMLLLIR